MKIEQSDRIAAASICAIAELRVQILAGEFDDHDYVQAFAKHRLDERKAITDWLREDWDESLGSRVARKLADSIEGVAHCRMYPLAQSENSA